MFIDKYYLLECRGLGDRTKRRIVVEVLHDNGAEIFCLEETKLENLSILLRQEIILKRKFDMILKKYEGGIRGYTNRSE